MLVAIVKKRLYFDQSLYTILQLLSVMLFEKMPILQALQPMTYKAHDGDISNQLKLFDC